jgi:hypothetical protein
MVRPDTLLTFPTEASTTRIIRSEPSSNFSITRSGREDITVTIDNQGAVKIWDDYNLLDTYTRFYSQTMGDFT